MRRLAAGLTRTALAIEQVLEILDALEVEPSGFEFVPFAEVRDHLELGPPATEGPLGYKATV